MDEEIYSPAAIDVKPINSNCKQNTSTTIQSTNSNNEKLDHTNNQLEASSVHDHTNNVKPLYGGNIYKLKNYEIIYKKKKFQIKSNNINKALLYLVNSLNINHDCLFEVKTNKKKNDIYHFKNNKRKIINKIN